MTSFHVETTASRLSALDDTNHIIAGAFLQGSYWHFYLTTTWAEAIGIEFRPDHLPLFNRDQALHWVEIMAAAYCRASEREAA